MNKTSKPNLTVQTHPLFIAPNDYVTTTASNFSRSHSLTPLSTNASQSHHCDLGGLGGLGQNPITGLPRLLSELRPGQSPEY